MPKGNRTTLFVSSTCYDLAQVRVDLRKFLESLGLEPILSEFDSFPIDPSKSTIENCLHVVRTRADIFLLIVGTRYGSLADATRSITNLEYVEASARSIPRYVFVKREILSLLSVWKANPTADFRDTVDSPQLFEFVAHLRESGSVWVFPFDTAQDIASTLRKQLSYLLADCLDVRSKLQTCDPNVLRLGPESLRIYVERQPAWEYLTFAKLLQEQMQSHRQKRLDVELELPVGKLVHLPSNADAIIWVSEKFSQFKKIIDSITKSINFGLEKAFGEPGEAGDINRIHHIALRVSDGYEKILDWTLDFYGLDVDASLERIMFLASQFSTNSMREIENFSDCLFDRIKAAVDNHQSGDSVNFTLMLTVHDVTEFNLEMQRLLDGR